MTQSSDELLRGRFWDRVLNWLALIVIVTFLPTLLWWVIGPARESGRQASCMGQFKMISLGMLNYEAQHRCLPPAYSVDRHGRPAHSWRVTLLPHLGAYDVLDRYRFDEPWNSPHNSALAQGAPAGMTFFYPLFHCPSDSLSSKWDTSYVMVVGPRTVSNGPKSHGLRDIPDGASQTILVAEMCESGIHWMEPRDLRTDQMSFRINDPEYVGISSRHTGGATVGFADGHEAILKEDTASKLAEGMTTIDGGENVSEAFAP